MKDLERRVYNVIEMRVEDEDKEPRLRGHAAVFDSDSVEMWGFVERVAPGAFTRTLKEADNIHALWSHDSALPLGSTRGGKLDLREDKVGLAFDLSGKRLNEAQLDAVRDGDMRMSFGFRTKAEKWEERKDMLPLRTLLDVDLFEISLVTMPAYPDTDVGVRSLAAWREQQPNDADEQVAAAQAAAYIELMTLTNRLARVL